ncbi:MAG TPA: hypothetical protein VFJ96_12530 [Gemmatimonadaceae bacterium]|jgi:hypothetical protein|nr:hypothetical protein [Gemmatimonadaceae bacterium]
MSLTAYSSDSGGFVLHAHGRAIGWIEGRGIGFVGFGSTGDALTAALAAHAALVRWSVREHLDEADTRGDSEIIVRPDGSQEWLLLDGRPVGQLIAPGRAPMVTTEPAFGFELFLPRRVGPVAALGLAHVIHHQVNERGANGSDVRDAMRRPDDTDRPVPAAAR